MSTEPLLCASTFPVTSLPSSRCLYVTTPIQCRSMYPTGVIPSAGVSGPGSSTLVPSISAPKLSPLDAVMDEEESRRWRYMRAAQPRATSPQFAPASSSAAKGLCLGGTGASSPAKGSTPCASPNRSTVGPVRSPLPSAKPSTLSHMSWCVCVLRDGWSVLLPLVSRVQHVREHVRVA